MIKETNGQWTFTPRSLGTLIGALVAAMLLALISFVKALNIDDADRYRGRDARRDLAVIESRLDNMERQLEMHREEDWHQGAGESLSELRERINNIRREHNWITNENPPQ